MIKIELNQKSLPQHTAIDAVLLAGYQPKSDFQAKMINHEIIRFQINDPQSKMFANNTDTDKNGNDLFSNLPVSVFH